MIVKILKVMRELHTMDYGLDHSPGAVLKQIKGVKHIKGMALLLVRQCILHKVTDGTSLGEGKLGKNQGLSLLFADFELGDVDYSMLNDLVMDVQSSARRLWETFKGTPQFVACDGLMRATLLNG